MGYDIEQNYVTNHYARSRQKIDDVRFLVAHETANNSADADDHQRYFDGIDHYASAHTFIDDGKILEIIPLDEKAWHVNYGKPTDNQLYGDDANDVAIGVELCRTGDFKKAYDKYVWYFAYLCKKFGLNPETDIVAHSKLDPERRSDPQSWLEPNGILWEEFIDDVCACFDGNKTEPAPSTQVDAIEIPWHLKKGDNGSEVKTMQQKLIKLGYDLGGYGADGNYGNDTVDAVKAFQRNENITVDGIYGVGSRKAMKSAESINAIKVDGYWGTNTTKVLQLYLDTPVDSIISGQVHSDVTAKIKGVHYGEGGSTVIKSLQRLIGAKVDGYIGTTTVYKLQKHLGTYVDGIISSPSNMVKELQRRLNRGKL